MATVVIPGDVLQAAMRAIKAPEGGSQEDELKQLLRESAGKGADGKPFFRYAFAAADYLYSDPDRLTKGKNGLAFVDVQNTVVTLLRRQVRLDAASDAVIPTSLSAQALLDEVLASVGKASDLRTADLEAI